MLQIKTLSQDLIVKVEKVLQLSVIKELLKFGNQMIKIMYKMLLIGMVNHVKVEQELLLGQELVVL